MPTRNNLRKDNQEETFFIFGSIDEEYSSIGKYQVD